MTQEKLIDRLQKLYAKAESAKEIGNEAEAMAFMAKVTELLKKHKMDSSVLTLAQQDKEEPLGTTRVDGRGKKTRVAWVERLAGYVARAHYCRILVYTGSDRILLVGRETDRQVAEYVLVKLVNWLEHEAKTQHSALRYKLWKENDGDMSGAHGFKAAFLNAAVARIGERYREMRTEDVSASKKYALVVTKSTKEVDDYLKSKFDTRTASAVRGQQGYNAAGREAGRAAGSRADLTGRGVGGGSRSGRISKAPGRLGDGS